jgi:preprotein translocase subunit SecF
LRVAAVLGYLLVRVPHCLLELLPSPLQSGSLFIIHFDSTADEAAIRAVFASHGLSDPIVQRLGAPEDNTWQIRTKETSSEQEYAILNDLDSQVAPVNRNLLTYETVTPSIGSEATRAAGLAVLASSALIIGFICWIYMDISTILPRRENHSVIKRWL